MGFSILEAAILAVIQGMTEWLPISSSGHLAAAGLYLNISAPMLFNLAVHVGTLAAVVWVLRKDVVNVLRATPGMLVRAVRFQAPPRAEKDQHLAFLLMVATLPAATFGYIVRGWTGELYYSPIHLAMFFIITGLILLSTRKEKPTHELNKTNTIVMGIAQIATVFPGISRSGTTIAMGMHAGLKREEAARFSFLMSIPLILGAAVFEAFYTTFDSSIIPQILIGMAIAFVVGALTIDILRKVVKEGHLHYFAPYCLAIGSIILIVMCC